MTTSAPPRAGVLRGAYRRTAPEDTTDTSPTMPGIRPAEPPPTIEALQPAAIDASPGGPGQTLLHLRLPGQNTADFSTAIRALAGALLTPRQARWFRSARIIAEDIAALELVGEPERVTFGIRGPTRLVARIFAQLVAGYRQVEPVPIDPTTRNGADPLFLQPGEAASSTELHLEKPAAIPLYTPDLRNPRAFAEGADPLAGILEALAATPEPLRVVSQIVVQPAPARWEHQNRALLEQHEQKRRHMGTARPAAGNEWGTALLLLLLGVGLLGLWLAMQGLLGLFFLVLKIGGPLVFVGGLGLAWRLGWRSAQLQRWAGHEAVIAEKLSGSVVQTCVRLYVIGPASTKPLREQVLGNLVDLYTSATAGANRLVPKTTAQIGPVRLGCSLAGEDHHQAMRTLPLAFAPRSRWQRLLLWQGGDRCRPVLSIPETAILWHFPQTADDTPYLTVQSSRTQLPPPDLFLIRPEQLPGIPLDQMINPWAWPPDKRSQLGGFWGGITRAAGKSFPLRFPDSMLDGHIGIVAATGGGKSKLMEQLAVWAAADPEAAIIVFDPHSALQRTLRGMLPKEEIKRGRVVVIDPTDAAPVGFHSLWDPQAAGNRILQKEIISNIVGTMERLSQGAWGQRVRTNFITGLTTLMNACAADLATGRDLEYHTLLDLQPLFTSPAYQAHVRTRLDTVSPERFTLQAIWTYQHGVYQAQQELQEVQSVLNRIEPLLLGVGGYVLGQRPARLSLRQVIQEHKVCLISLGGLGQDTRKSVGSLILSYLQGVLLEQQWLEASTPTRVLVMVDELHAFDAEALTGLLGEVRKFGGRVVVGTNSLTTIQKDSPRLFEEMEANIGTWFAGRTGMNDAKLLLQRLQGNWEQPFSVRDVLRLSNHHFLVGALVDDTPRPLFSFETLEPPPPNPQLSELALDLSRQNYGKARAEVEEEMHAPAWQFEVNRLLDEQEQQQKRQRQGKKTQTGSKSGKNDQHTAGNQGTPDPAEARSEAEATVRANAVPVDEEEQADATEAEAHPADTEPMPPAGAGRAAFGDPPKRPHPHRSRAERQPPAPDRTLFDEGVAPVQEGTG